MKSNDLLLLALVAAILYLQFQTPNPNPDTGGGAKPLTLTKELEQIREIGKTNPVAAHMVADFYASAESLARSRRVVTAQQLIDAVAAASEIKVESNPELRLPGFGKACDEYLKTVIGDSAVPLDQERRSKLREAFRSIAYALEV